MHNEDRAQVWVLADDRTGNTSQCVGVAEALGWPFAVKDIRYDAAGRLPNLIRGASLLGVIEESRAQLKAPWPKVVIAAGRRTAPVARWLKRQSGARLVQIMDPGPGGRDEFDIIFIPAHDAYRKGEPNVSTITGAPHRVTAQRLAEAGELWRPRFEHLPRPWIGLVVGGTTHQREFTPQLARELGKRTAALARGGSILATTSRRTSEAAEAALLPELPEPRFVHSWRAGGDNPFFGLLALADALVVTGESTSMLCECCSTPAPVYVFSPEGMVVPKHARFQQDLYQRGLARPLEPGTLLEAWSHAPLNDAGNIATIIRERFA
ncbi:MAG TPA: mitochondrial fission ELM1 family protein [Magnetospirillum sp.]|jgi:mitochondrial fission protein ELM1|nr:mitochondrial fission ELM1 family protein [Magnetospirillum sp.]